MALKRTPPNLAGQPNVSFRKNDFDATIWNKGYPILVEKAVRCPCSGADGNALSNCTNCLGTGFFYINPFETRAIATGINAETKDKEWSVEKMGTISLTVIDDNDELEKLSFFDRVTLKKLRNDTADIYGLFTEKLDVRESNDNDFFVFLTYKPVEIIEIWAFVSPFSPLVLVDKALYSIKPENPYVVVFDSSVTFDNNMVSVRYKHDIQYHVIDVPHEVRYSLKTDFNGAEEHVTLPIQAVARRVHFIPRANYDGTGIINNSYR